MVSEREGEKYLRQYTSINMRAVLLTMFDSVLCSLQLLDLSIVLCSLQLLDFAVSD